MGLTCTATVDDPAGSGLRIRCQRYPDHPLDPPTYVDSQTDTNGFHHGTTSLGETYFWQDTAVSAQPRPEVAQAPTAYTHEHRTFQLYRRTDVTGVSGTGVVAEGCQFSDGRVALRWVSARGKASTASWDSLADLLEVHGHDGATTVEWT